MCLVWKYGEYNKSYERGSRKCHLEVLSIYILGIVGLRVGRVAADFYPQLLKNRFLHPVCLLRIVIQLVEMLACLLPCSGVTDKWPLALSRSFYAGPAKWRENNGAKMTSRSRKKFPARVSELKRVKITLACFKSLTAADLSPKDNFDQLFNFQGPVISECTIVGSHVPRIQHQILWLLARSVVRTTKIFNLPFSFRKDEESQGAMLVARSPHWRECRQT